MSRAIKLRARATPGSAQRVAQRVAQSRLRLQRAAALGEDFRAGRGWWENEDTKDRRCWRHQVSDPGR